MSDVQNISVEGVNNLMDGVYASLLLSNVMDDIQDGAIRAPF